MKNSFTKILVALLCLSIANQALVDSIEITGMSPWGRICSKSRTIYASRGTRVEVIRFNPLTDTLENVYTHQDEEGLNNTPRIALNMGDYYVTQVSNTGGGNTRLVRYNRSLYSLYNRKVIILADTGLALT